MLTEWRKHRRNSKFTKLPLSGFLNDVINKRQKVRPKSPESFTFFASSAKQFSGVALFYLAFFGAAGVITLSVAEVELRLDNRINKEPLERNRKQPAKIRKLKSQAKTGSSLPFAAVRTITQCQVETLRLYLDIWISEYEYLRGHNAPFRPLPPPHRSAFEKTKSNCSIGWGWAAGRPAK